MISRNIKNSSLICEDNPKGSLFAVGGLFEKLSGYNVENQDFSK